MNLQMFKLTLDLEKAEEPEIKLPTSVGSLKKQETWVQSLNWEDPLEEGMATLSGILA